MIDPVLKKYILQPDSLILAEEYQMLMQGLEIVARYPIEKVSSPEISL